MREGAWFKASGSTRLESSTPKFSFVSVQPKILKPKSRPESHRLQSINKHHVSAAKSEVCFGRVISRTSLCAAGASGTRSDEAALRRQARRCLARSARRPVSVTAVRSLPAADVAAAYLSQ